jgi:cobalamin biosynthesis protein CbiG
MELIQIVPYLPPAHEGVGGYAAALARELRERLGVESRFVTGDPAPGSTVLLHYANYGYQTRGCPGAEPAALEGKRRGPPGDDVP